MSVVFVTVTPRYLNFSTFSIDKFPISIIIYVVLSTSTLDVIGPKMKRFLKITMANDIQGWMGPKFSR